MQQVRMPPCEGTPGNSGETNLDQDEPQERQEGRQENERRLKERMSLIKTLILIPSDYSKNHNDFN